MTALPQSHRSLGAILAGGASRRFGSPKALAVVEGRPIVERVKDAVARVVPRVVLIANDPGLFEGLGLPARPDDVPGLGALAGIWKALEWAREVRRPGALCVACDMPFLSPGLLDLLLVRAAESRADAVVPESRGPRGVEPLCAWYSTECLAAVRAQAGVGNGTVAAVLQRVRTERVPLAEIERVGDPDVLFFNVNTSHDYWRAVLMAAEGADAPA
ncbi:MAG TPA: molybdenum cofactor guanylyltransferase [Longimicrobium sp.]|jgi:molybdopterin-guanine dinucleotide biosynthesis protein A